MFLVLTYLPYVGHLTSLSLSKIRKKNEHFLFCSVKDLLFLCVAVCGANCILASEKARAVPPKPWSRSYRPLGAS